MADSQILEIPIVGDSQLSAVGRLDIYATAYFFRIYDCLRDDFPALLNLVGEAHFNNLITDYLWKYPSRHWSLRFVGDRFPSFLKSHPLQIQFPYAADLATFEYAIKNVFDAKDVKLLTQKELIALPPEAWGDLELCLIPSFQWVKTEFRVDQIRDKGLKQKKVGRLKKKSTTYMVWRNDFRVFHRSVDKIEEALLLAVQKKSSFGELCHSLAQKKSEVLAANLATQYLRKWLYEGLLESFGRFS
jgi:hypothetical protein